MGIVLGAAGLLATLMPIAHADQLATNFVSRCAYSHSAPDDPIVFFGQRGASHLHDFIGNKTTDAFSTHATLRRGGTTCHLPGDTGAYWAPALYDDGKLKVPTKALIYYRLGTKARQTIRAFPAGLKVLAKNENVRVHWWCFDRNGQGTKYTAIPTCPDGTALAIDIRFPDCWNGRSNDSADHSSHMAFNKNGACPSSHPRPMPQLSLNIEYPSDGGNIVLGSPDKPVAAHADFFNSWDQKELERLVRVCLNAGRHCSTRPPNA